MAGLINFENEAEVKEFLENLGVEYSFQCYKEKDPEGNNSRRCHDFSGAEHSTCCYSRYFIRHVF